MCTSGRPVSFGRTSRSSRSGGGSGGLGTFFDVRQANLTVVARLGAAVLVALAVAGVPSFIDGPATRFTPCEGSEVQACARLGGDGPPVRLQHAPGTPPTGVPGRLAVVFGAAAEASPEVLRQAVLRTEGPSAVGEALRVLDRPAVVVGGLADTGAVLAAARPGGVDGVMLIDPEAAARLAGPPLPVSLLVVAERPPARAIIAASVRPLVLLRGPGAPNACTRRVVAGFARDPLSPRPAVTDCR